VLQPQMLAGKGNRGLSTAKNNDSLQSRRFIDVYVYEILQALGRSSHQSFLSKHPATSAWVQGEN
jgi:hypothetical protein